MATLTPGVLLKLLQTMHADERVAGKHRSPVLQVTAVVPAPSSAAADNDDSHLLSPANGVHLNLSDGRHCTYVQLPRAEADALLLCPARPLQVGDLVHVDRLRFALPVPRAVGLRPVPSFRPLPCVGNPERLVARAAPCSRGYAIQPAAATTSGDVAPPSSCYSFSDGGTGTIVVKRPVLAPKNVVAPSVSSAAGSRFSSPASKRRAPSPSAAKPRGGSRAQSPAVRQGAPRASSPAVRRTASPVPSRCAVPGLVAAKEENRTTAREPAIIVPSRYRQPSPSAGWRRAASPAVGRRRPSPSPSSRRMSGEGTSRKHKQVGVLAASRELQDEAQANSLMNSRAKVDMDGILRTQEAMSRRFSDATTELFSNDDSSVDEKPNPRMKIDSTSIAMRAVAPKIIVHDAKWTDGSVPLDAVSGKLSKIGKNAIELRNAAATVAASALQEASIAESVIRNLSKFSDICSSSKTTDPLPTIDLFLAVYEDTLKWKTLAESEEDAAVLEKSATQCVDASLATDLQVHKLLLSGATGSLSSGTSSRGTIIKPIKTAPPSVTMERPLSRARTMLEKHQSAGGASSAKVHQPSTAVMSEAAAELALTLWRETHTWFLDFVDEALDVGFHLFEEVAGRATSRHGSHVAAVLSRFERVSDWLDRVAEDEDEATREKVERLKSKLYGFVVTHMGSALES